MTQSPGSPPPPPGVRSGEPTGQPARYARTSRGLLASMLVTVLAVVGFVALRGVTRDELEVRPEPVDYLATVGELQAGGQQPVYPPELPTGWMATSLDVVPGDRPAWGLSMLTASDRFAGLRQEDTSLDKLLTTYVDEQAEESAPVTVSGSVASRWRSFSDAGGDHAYAAQVGEDWVLVFGSASTDDLLALVARLTTRDVTG